MKKQMAAVMLAGLVSYAQAEEQTSAPASKDEQASITFKTDMLGKYVYRGFALSNGPVIQQTTTISKGGFSANWFTNVEKRNGGINEHDFTVSYYSPIDKNTSAAFGYTAYTFRHIPSTEIRELYGSISLDQGLKPYLLLSQSYRPGRGTYMELGISPPLLVGNKTITLEAALSHNNHYLREGRGWSHARVGLSIAIPSTEQITLIPQIVYQKPLSAGFQKEF